MKITLVTLLLASLALNAQTGIQAKFDPITEIKLGRKYKVELVNVHVCNYGAVEVRDFALERILFSSNITPLTSRQALWFLTQKKNRAFPTMVERLGISGLAIAALNSTPWAAAGIPIVQQIADFIKGEEPDIAPFVADLLPDTFNLGPSACRTGTMFQVNACYNPKACSGVLPLAREPQRVVDVK